MIDLKNKIIFIHIPKTGGQSIEDYFLRINDLSNKDKASLFLFKNSRESNMSRSNDHLTLEMYEKYYFGGEIPEDFKIFSVVRNPYNRFVSESKYSKLRFGFIKFRLPMRFLIFIYKRYGKKVNIFRDIYDHLIPQIKYLEGNARNRIIILRLENLNSEFERLVLSWGLPNHKLKHINKSASSVKRSNHLSPDILKFINNEYKEDFNEFNYDMGLFKQ